MTGPARPVIHTNYNSGVAIQEMSNLSEIFVHNSLHLTGLKGKLSEYPADRDLWKCLGATLVQNPPQTHSFSCSKSLFAYSMSNSDQLLISMNALM